MATNLSQSIPRTSPTVDVTEPTARDIHEGRVGATLQAKRHATRLAQTHRGDWTFITGETYKTHTYWRSPDGAILSVCVPCKALQIKRVMCECGNPATEYVGGRFGCGRNGCIPF